MILFINKKNKKNESRKHTNREENYLRPSQNHPVLEGRDQPTPGSQTHAHAEINPDRHRGKNRSPPQAKSPRAGSPRSTHAHPEINPHPDRHRDNTANPPTANRNPDRRRDQNPNPRTNRNPNPRTNPTPPSTQPHRQPNHHQKINEGEGRASYGEQRERTEKRERAQRRERR